MKTFIEFKLNKYGILKYTIVIVVVLFSWCCCCSFNILENKKCLTIINRFLGNLVLVSFLCSEMTKNHYQVQKPTKCHHI